MNIVLLAIALVTSIFSSMAATMNPSGAIMGISYFVPGGRIP
jgi:hypothetical protein